MTKTIRSEVCQEQGLLLTISTFNENKFKWRIGCAVTGAFLKGGEGYSDIAAADKAMRKSKSEVSI